MRILDFLLRSDYTKSIFKLTTGSVIAQGITFLFMLVLTRIYSPSDFGIFTLYISILSFIAIISTGKYDIAIVIAKNYTDAIALVKLSLIICLIVSGIAGLVVVMNGILPVGFYKNHPIINWLYLLPVSIIFISLVQILWMWNVRQKQFNILNYSRVSDALLAGSVPVVASFFGPIALLAGNLSGQFVSMVINAYNFVKKDHKILFNSKKAELMAVARQYKEFPKVNILQGFIDTFQTMGIVLIGSRFLTTAEIGYYSLGLRILQVPMGLVIKPVANVFFSEASEMARSGKSIYALVKETVLKSTLIILPFVLIILFFGPVLFQFLFGPEWHEAGIYAQILSVWFFFDLIRAPVSQAGIVLGKQRQILYVSITGSALLLMTLIAGELFFAENARLILFIISITQSLVIIYLLYRIFKMTKDKSLIY